MTLKLSELIAEYGDDVVQFQNLDQCVSNLNMNGKHTTAKFGTEQPIDFNGFIKLGLIVWMDRKKVAEIIAKSKGGAA